MLVQALADENWIEIVPAAYVLLDQEKEECLVWDEKASGCLRGLNRERMSQAVRSAPHLAPHFAPRLVPHVILLVQGDTHQARATCIGTGDEPSETDAKSLQVAIQAALFASEKERRMQRQAIVQCLLAEMAEGR